jgi:hypothetical protein
MFQEDFESRIRWVNDSDQKQKKAPGSLFKFRSSLRSQGSNLGPSGYEPDELPLLYFAMWIANLRSYLLPSKLILN